MKHSHTPISTAIFEPDAMEANIHAVLEAYAAQIAGSCAFNATACYPGERRDNKIAGLFAEQ